MCGENDTKIKPNQTQGRGDNLSKSDRTANAPVMNDMSYVVSRIKQL